jgi:hypothetical protein
MIVFASLFLACGSETPARMDAYLGPSGGQGASSGQPSMPEGGIQAGLLVINDTSAPDSAPPLSPEAFAALSEGIRVQIMNAVPISFVRVLDNNGVTPNGDSQQMVALARQAGVNYLMVAILSSNESEVPTYLPINGIIQGGGGPPTTPGYEAQNFALAELALLDGNTGSSLVQTHGRAYATLYRLNVPTESNAYPVVVRSRLFNPIFPQGNNAHDTLRGIAADDAIKKGVLELTIEWNEKFST